MALSSTGLFKFGSYEFPSTFIVEGGYEIKPNQRQDLDPFTDQTGLTHRNALDHTKTEIAITTREGLSDDDFKSILNNLRSNYRNYNERDANCEYYDPENNRTSTGHFYLESSQPYTLKTKGKRWPATTFTFVEY
jgi:hypothetical protein